MAAPKPWRTGKWTVPAWLPWVPWADIYRWPSAEAHVSEHAGGAVATRHRPKARLTGSANRWHSRQEATVSP